MHRLQVLIHELFHTAGYNHPSQMWYGTAFWLDDIESDICRFAQLPRAPREISEVFDMSIDQRILSEKAEALGLTGQELKLPDLSEVIDHLVGTEKLYVTGDGCNQSLVYKEGRRWVF